MKRYSLILAVLILCCATAALAQFPNPTYGRLPTVGNGYLPFVMQQGWYGDAAMANGQIAWFIMTVTDSIRWAQPIYMPPPQPPPMTLAPELRSANALSARMWVIRNPFATQGPIFEAKPGLPLYSGIWKVIYVDLIKAYFAANPTQKKAGFTSGKQVNDLIGLGAATTTAANVTIDAPILAIGPLGGPWLTPSGSTTVYRIKQGRVASNYAYTKIVSLPCWNVFYQDPITRHIYKPPYAKQLIITDVGTSTIPTLTVAGLANLIGANYAPNLQNVPDLDTQRFGVRDWMQAPPLGPPPPGQLPVIQQAPNGPAWRNTNFLYSPVMRFVLLRRVAPPPTIAPGTILSSDAEVQAMINAGLLAEYLGTGAAAKINAPVLWAY